MVQLVEMQFSIPLRFIRKQNLKTPKKIVAAAKPVLAVELPQLPLEISKEELLLDKLVIAKEKLQEVLDLTNNVNKNHSW